MRGRYIRADSTSPDELLVKVLEAYSRASDNPSDSHPFPPGFDFALSLGYPVELLRSLPQSSVARFTGVSNVSVFAEIPAGSIVLDLGCGGGTDSLIAAAKAGPGGRLYLVDVVVCKPVPDAAKEIVDLWTA
ncbi:MAG: hypothetical protein MK109_02435 [Dehalococcoidia bacterium]|nr:hypothetical protein [Dehalococcoidia bacterium]